MTRYFTSLMTFMFVLAITGIMFGGIDSRQGIAITGIFSLASAAVIYWLYPFFTSREK